MPDFLLRKHNPPGLWDSPRFSQVVEVRGGRLIHLAGQVAVDATGRPVAGDFRAQFDRVMDNIDIALASVGATLENVVKTTTYLTRVEDIAALRAARADRLGHLAAPPANTLLVVTRLAEPEFLLEIELVAAVSE